jgi:SET domain-containing protein
MPPSRSQKRRLTEAAAVAAVVAESTHAASLGDRERGAMSLGRLDVRDTGTDRGRGLFATAPLSHGAFLGEYTGDVLTHDEYLARYPAEDSRYVLAANTDYNIDAVDPERSSLLRYLNHSSTEPNCYYHVLRVRGQRQKRVSFFTLRAVEAGEELCFDYGQQYWTDRPDRPLQ